MLGKKISYSLEILSLKGGFLSILPIDLFGWMLSTLLAISFIGSLVALSKEPTSEIEKERSFVQSTISEKKIKDRPTMKIY
jgi:hypothetical protein